MRLRSWKQAENQLEVMSDFVLTFEEVMGMFEAKEVDLKKIKEESSLSEATASGRGFAVSGGVAQAVVDCLKKMDENEDVKVVSAQGLADCRKMLTLAKTGKYDGYLLEGMGCPGGCVGGAGTLRGITASSNAVNIYKNKTEKGCALDNDYTDMLHKLD